MYILNALRSYSIHGYNFWAMPRTSDVSVGLMVEDPGTHDKFELQMSSEQAFRVRDELDISARNAIRLARDYQDPSTHAIGKSNDWTA